MKRARELDEMITEEELAGKWKVSERQLQRYRKGKGLPFYKIGGIIRYHPAEVTQWLRRFHKTAAPTLEERQFL